MTCSSTTQQFQASVGEIDTVFWVSQVSFFWFVGRYLDLRCFAKRDGHFCFPGHFSKTLGEEEAKAPAKAAWEIIEININRLAR